MDILDELYYGNISPFERHTDRNPECRELQGFITRHMETLKEKLDGDGQETLEKLEPSSHRGQRKIEGKTALRYDRSRPSHALTRGA